MKTLVHTLALLCSLVFISDDIELPIYEGECRWHLYYNKQKSVILSEELVPIPILGTEYSCAITPTREVPLMLVRAIVCKKPNDNKRFAEGAACGRRDSMRSRTITVGTVKLAIGCERK